MELTEKKFKNYWEFFNRPQREIAKKFAADKYLYNVPSHPVVKAVKGRNSYNIGEGCSGGELSQCMRLVFFNAPLNLYKNIAISIQNVFFLRPFIFPPAMEICQVNFKC